MKKLLELLFAPYCRMPGRSARDVPALTEHEKLLCRRLNAHIRLLSETIGERNERQLPALRAAADYIEKQFLAAGAGDIHRETVSIPSPDAGQIQADNIILELPGEGLAGGDIFVIGAHYDTVFGSPGANDNGSGVAALLEIAHILARSPRLKTVRLVAFCNEEHPNMPAQTMGSYTYATLCKSRNDSIVGMWSLETLGFFSDQPGSQNYPAPFNKLYPSTGNFLAFVGNFAARQWVRESVDLFRQAVSFPSEGVAAPEKFADINRSDNWGFSQCGYPALMITDTANFRYPWYHTSADSADKVHCDQLARIVRGLAQAAVEISAKP